MRIDRDISDKSRMRLQNNLDRVTKNASEKDSEIILLKKSIKSLNEEKNVHKIELSKARKEIKEKEKEIHRLETKTDNAAITLKSWKDQYNAIKKVKSNLEKELKKKDKSLKNLLEKKLNLSSTTSSFTSTLPVTLSSSTISLNLLPLIASTPNLSCCTTSNSTTVSLSSTSSNPNPSPLPVTSCPTLPISPEAETSTYSILSSSTPSPGYTTGTGSDSSTIPSTTSSPSSKIHPWNNVPLSIPVRDNCRSRCEHSMKCTPRQPRPPPLPSITFLFNEKSKYHLHMMTWSREEFSGCQKCFSVDNENYGCDNCTWLKWWLKWHGELHGYPDTSPWAFQKLL